MRSLVFSAVGFLAISSAAGVPSWALVLLAIGAFVVIGGLCGVAETLQGIACVLLGIADGWKYARQRRREWSLEIYDTDREQFGSAQVKS